MPNTIMINNLTKIYKNKRGVQDISLEVAKGEIFGFLGPNGAGKTTVMKIMTGLMQPDSGTVTINGYSVHTDYEKAMGSVGCIIENVALFPYMTAYENMKMCANYYNDVDDNTIEKCLKITGMLKYRNEKIKNYSLGMRQRMGIAQAILSNPGVLILDEPLNGLDVEGMVEMRKLFQSLSEENGTTVFISSHLIHDVELTCTRVGIVSNGRLLRTDCTGDILKDFSSLENYYLSEVDVSANA